MYLEKLEVQGFKSFANKNTLVFPGMIDKTKRGITAVVGPNGAGKSNIADAIRWVLGEQSMKTLRGKKSEDIIFSGSDKKGKLGMAEVSLFLNNEDRQAPIDYSELIITRRLYRDGESEYLINNSRARLSDIQILLAKANVGQKTYSVIGQGMVEGFLNTSLSERKEFFDEATGVKQFQIKRDSSLNKLRSSYENLDQVGMLLNEIEPRLKSLTRQVSKLKKRGELEVELKSAQIKYYGKIWHDIKIKFSGYNNEYLEMEKVKMEKEGKLEQFNRELAKMENNQNRNQEYDKWQTDLSKIQSERNSLIKEAARIDAQIEIKLESEGKFDMSWLKNKKSELEESVRNIKIEIEQLSQEIETVLKKENQFVKDKEDLDTKIRELNNELMNLNRGVKTNDDIKIEERLKKHLVELIRVEEDNDIERIKAIIRAIREDINEIVSHLAGDDKVEQSEELMRIQESIMKVTEEREKIFAQINEERLTKSGKRERARLLEEKIGQIKDELKSIEEKLTQNENTASQDDLKKQELAIKEKIKALDGEYLVIKEKIDNVKAREEEERSRLFGLQRNIQSFQNEINGLSQQLGELKVNSTRYETKLEDLEIQIRQNLGGLKEIKEFKSVEEIDVEAVRLRINDLKKQLEQIGGIDPETEKEYDETKERYDFLLGQVNDLREAIKSLEEVIKELDTTIKEKFDKEFKKIQEKFVDYFKILFNGGAAKIIKVMDDELQKGEKSEGGQEGVVKNEGIAGAEADMKRLKFLQKHNATGLAGIEIQATPPGKKIQSIAMLSGGERALTAIALICAIISANPSPFVVLDEVDAALDEANSERLARILDDLSHKTQFIVISHNRASMRRANILYGVTMQDDGVSKLLSVKLEDVKMKK